MIPPSTLGSSASESSERPHPDHAAKARARLHARDGWEGLPRFYQTAYNAVVPGATSWHNQDDTSAGDHAAMSSPPARRWTLLATALDRLQGRGRSAGQKLLGMNRVPGAGRITFIYRQVMSRQVV